MNSNSEPAKEFLLEEFKYFQESFWKNETVGETRVNFFISLVTAVLAGLIALVTSQVDLKEGVTLEKIPPFTLKIITMVLSGLLLLGLVTLSRISKRNSVTDEFKREMDKIRQRFKDYFDSNGCLDSYSPFIGIAVPKGLKPDVEGILSKFLKKIGIRMPGGLASIVAAMNGILLMGIVASSNQQASTTALLISGIVFILFQIVCVSLIEFRANKKTRKNSITHAGGIVFTLVDEAPKFLLTTAKQNSEEWVFPKGHIENNESHNEAAVREVVEETGFLSRVVRPLGVSGFVQNKIIGSKQIEEKTICKYYLMECITTAYRETDEQRSVKWLSYEETRAQIKFSDARQLLDQAKYFLDRSTIPRK